MPAGRSNTISSRPRWRTPFILFICLWILSLMSCRPSSTSTSSLQEKQLGGTQTAEVTASVPTIAPFFVPPQRTPTTANLPSATPLPTETPIKPKTRDANTKSVLIYSNEINPDWEIVQNTEVLVSETGRPNTYEGRSALQVTPLQDFGQLIFRVKPDAQNTYLRSQVLALMVWISGGPNYIDTDDLAITVLGSNRYPYWTADDRSVYDGPDSPFSETRLYYLGLSNAIPPNTWAEAINWLDDRQFDPNYRFVTGFYIKNDEGFESTYFIDEISLLMIDDPSKPTPSGTITLTPTDTN